MAAVVPAGGSGVRVGRRTPKQFLLLRGVPILTATVRHFVTHPAIEAVVVAAPVGQVERARRVLGPLARNRSLAVVAGGITRQESVWRAMQAVSPDVEVIVVHDAVRPFVTRRLIDAVLRAVREGGAAICALPIAETVKRVREDLVEATLDRSGLWAVQTPQAFRAALLREAHDKARRDGVVGTDDAMLVERLGHPVTVVRGSEENVKITTVADLRRARTGGRR
ncbi:MAG: 2-C-methyl-D-erythritol 4-phosphate cytidylyltransferase [Candidatus Rokubacteria bacterium]|nr:2-C-methyl-D-erythritol 4-phosphate cytidylyltransferase [Candidatus Rokubacteria bacterium]